MTHVGKHVLNLICTPSTVGSRRIFFVCFFCFLHLFLFSQRLISTKSLFTSFFFQVGIFARVVRNLNVFLSQLYIFVWLQWKKKPITIIDDDSRRKPFFKSCMRPIYRRFGPHLFVFFLNYFTSRITVYFVRFFFLLARESEMKKVFFYSQASY